MIAAFSRRKIGSHIPAAVLFESVGAALAGTPANEVEYRP